jgi:hypothetical protein
MGFIIINNQKVSEHRIEWKFETNERVFVSHADKFKRNVQFWKAKLMIGDDVQVEILNGAQTLYEHLEAEKGIIDVEHEEINQTPTEHDTLIDDSVAVESDSHQLDAQPDMGEVAEDTVSAPKRKRKPKTTNL